MKKINWNLFHLALWAEILLSYLLPYHLVAEGQRQIGFPFPFLKIYDTASGITPMLSTHLNPLSFLLNAALLYLLFTLAITVFRSIKHCLSVNAQ